MLEHRRDEEKLNGSFTPSAAVLLAPTFQDSGLLRLLSPTQAQALWGVLSLVSPNGTFSVTPQQLTRVLWKTISLRRVWQMERQLESLCGLIWNGEVILHRQQTETGLLFYFPSHHLFLVRDSRPSAPEPAAPVVIESGAVASGAVNSIAVAPREVVIAHSRATYAHPRGEVEARIYRFLTGQPTLEEEQFLSPETRQKLELGRRLRAVGLNREQIHQLLSCYSIERIERQLEWLPLRAARNRAAYLVHAIKDDYAPPNAGVSSTQTGEK